MVRVVTWSLACLLIAGCAGFGPDAGARRLLSQARASAEQRDLDAAYRKLVELHREHAGSPHDAQAFSLAAAIFKHQYTLNRFRTPESPWLTTEPGFMLEWFGSLLSGSTFPQQQADALFVGMHYGYFREFLAYAKTREPALRWSLRAQDDNGIIESVEAGPSPAPSGS